MTMDDFIGVLPEYLMGLVNTVWLTAAALLVGLLIAVPLAVLRVSSNPAVYGPVWAFTYFFRGTPLFVQLLLIYFGSGQFEVVRNSFAWPLLQEAWFCALLACALNTGAYTTEILRGAIQATPPGEIEAAKACGMSPGLMMRRVILPGAFRRALPAYGNEAVFMMHGTSVASQVTLLDLTGVASVINSRFYTPYEAFGTAALFYMALTFVIVLLINLAERRFHKHLKPRVAA